MKGSNIQYAPWALSESSFSLYNKPVRGMLFLKGLRLQAVIIFPQNRSLLEDNSSLGLHFFSLTFYNSSFAPEKRIIPFPFHSSLQDWSIGKYFIKERPILKNERRRHEREDSPGHRRLQRAKKFQQDVTLESSIVRSSFRSFLVSYE